MDKQGLEGYGSGMGKWNEFGWDTLVSIGELVRATTLHDSIYTAGKVIFVEK